MPIDFLRDRSPALTLTSRETDEPSSDGVVRDLAELLELSLEELQAVLHPLESPASLLRTDAASVLEPLPPAARRKLETLIRLFPAWCAAQPKPRVLRGPDDVARHMGPYLSGQMHEGFWVIGLDVRGRPLGTFEVARGTLTACLVHPREVFAPMIGLRAASVIAVHNHPSGDPRPSREDLELTQRLEDAGEVVGFPLLDHVIISASGYRSVRGPERFGPDAA